MPNLNLSYQWAINTCNAPDVGYSQNYRNQQTVNGITYYDCSSFIWFSLMSGGFDVVTANGGSTWPFTTSNMQAALSNLGFVQVEITADWMPGDVLWRSGHTEMVYQGRHTMGAHTGGIPLADQVSINAYETPPSSWTNCWRYGSGGAIQRDWIKGNRYLDLTEMQNNAYIIYSTLYFRGWTPNAIAGMLGNMETESTINPGIWQNLSENPSLGFGLVQWTPSTNYTNWAVANGYEIDDGDGQLIWIDTETVPSGQWIVTTEYPMAFPAFKVSKDSPEDLASVFLHNFERAGVKVEEERRQQARFWYNYIITLDPWLDPSNSKRKGLPVWMMAHRLW